MQEKTVKLCLDKNDSFYDIDCKIEELSDDLLVIPEIETNSLDDEKIHHYLDSEYYYNSEIRIILDKKNGLYIEDEEGNLLREIEFKDDFTLNENERILELIKKLLILL